MLRMRRNAVDTLAGKAGAGGVAFRRLDDHYPLETPSLEIGPGDWITVAKRAGEAGMKLVALWGAESAEDVSRLHTYMVFCHADGRVLVRASLDPVSPSLPSITEYFAYASRMERTLSDMFGIRVECSEDSRRWIKHEHWPAGWYPLRSSFMADTDTCLEVGGYDFLKADGDGVHEIPVGPVHAGIIEPGHFRFLAAGEEILNLEERLGYTHKGIEKRVQGMGAPDAVKIVSRVSGDSTVGHGWAFSMACENSSCLELPARANTIRGILCERERMANHLGDIGAVCNDAAFSFMHSQMQRLREEMACVHKKIFGHRLLMDLIVPGGVTVDIDGNAMDELKAGSLLVAKESEELREIYLNSASIQERVTGTGIVEPEMAESAGLLGFAGRASGISCDIRVNHPYPPYDRVKVSEARRRHGDVASRIKVRFDEIRDSAGIICRLLEDMPEGQIRMEWEPHGLCSGFSAVEGWRGEIVCWVSFDVRGTIRRCMVRDPSVLNWPGLELAVRGLPVPEFPLINKSFNCSYSGNDL